MLTAFLRAFRTPDLRRKLLFTIFIIAVFRLGSSLPTPGVSQKALQACLNTTGAKSNLFELVNLFSGGALLKLTVFALGIMPYITASIILQLLAVVIPRLETLRQEGQAGQAKITQYTRYLTIGLAILQSTGIIALATRGQLFGNCQAQVIPDQNLFTLAVMVVTMTAGTAIIMWFGELITERGVGNGMSILMFTSIAARIPTEGQNILQQGGGLVFTAICVFGLLIIGFSVYSLRSKLTLHLERDRPSWLAGIGFVAGILGGAYGMNGPPLAIYGALRRWSPQQFRATLQGYFLPASLVGLFGYAVMGLWTAPVTRYFVLSLPGILLAIVAGRALNRRLRGSTFLRFVYAGLAIVGIVLVGQALSR